MNRFIVKSVRKDDEKCVQIVELDNGQRLHLRQSWYHSLIEEGDCVSYESGQSDDSQQATTSASDPMQSNQMQFGQPPNQIITIDDTSASFMVVNPDRLVTSTDLSSVSFCLRKTWLGNRFKFYGDHNRATLLGTLIHSLFQDTIGDHHLTTEVLENKFLSLVKEPWVIRSLVAMNLNEEQLINDSKDYINSIVQFDQKFSSGKAAQFDQNHPNLKLEINKVTDIEDTVLAPNYGMKGKIDVTMDVQLHDRGTMKRQVATPFELKTGKVSFSFSHQGQISLYAMMLDKRSRPCNFGLLAYLKEGVSMKYVPINDCIRNSLILQRNELVHHLKNAKIGPETRTNISFCSNCEHLLDCCLLGQVYAPEKLASFYSNNPEFVPCVLSHLTEREVQFFQRYIDMIDLEERQLKEEFKGGYYWNRSAVELEAEKKAIGRLVLHRTEVAVPGEYMFERAQQYKSLGALPVDLQCGRADRITMSVENEDSLDKIGFVYGVIKSIDENYVSVQLDEKINESLLDNTFRLDIVPVISNCSFMYSAILRLMSEEERNSANLRAYLIGERAPTFNQKFAPNELDIARRICSDLNDCQRRAVIRSFNLDDYLLIKGFPGTGKSETIVRIVRILAELNKTVLICAHTNQAVDDILLRLLSHKVRFLRIGNRSRIHPNLLEHSEDQLVRGSSSMFGLKVKYLSYGVFAGTCHSMNAHLIFGLKKIDYCILDEASQLSLPESLLPLLDCERFILVGDSQQLPPIVKSEAARLAGLDQTLFDILSRQKTDDLWEDNSVSLTIQYGMNREIMRIANSCTYDHKLSCASDEVANSTLDLKWAHLEAIEIWMEACLSGDIELSVIFLDTDGSDDTERTDERNIKRNEDDGILFNQNEINISAKIVNRLIQCDCRVDQMGIISFYSQQTRLLKSSISATLDISTIDQYQGTAKDIVLISCVKSIKSSSTGTEILSDNRRLNVAITRAKKKLILVGSRSTLECYEPFGRLFACLNDCQIIKVSEKF